MVQQRSNKRLRTLLAACDERIAPAAREQLEALPLGWVAPVASMFSEVTQILDDSELDSFRWISIAKRDGRLVTSWTGATESAELVEQIVEVAAAEMACSCVRCGRPAVRNPDVSGDPLCLRHASLQIATADWKAQAEEMGRSIHELMAKVSESAAAAKSAASSSAAVAKSAAAALPALMAEAQAYFRMPDADAAPLIAQIREALSKFDREVRQSVGTTIVSESQRLLTGAARALPQRRRGHTA